MLWNDIGWVYWNIKAKRAYQRKAVTGSRVHEDKFGDLRMTSLPIALLNNK